MANARIAEVIPGVLNSEWIATDIHLRYNPAAQSGSVDFHFQQFIVPADGATLPFSADHWKIISYDLSALAARLIGKDVTDPVTNATLGFLSGLGTVSVFKKLADDVFNERAAAEAIDTSADPVAP